MIYCFTILALLIAEKKEPTPEVLLQAPVIRYYGDCFPVPLVQGDLKIVCWPPKKKSEVKH